MQSKIIRKIFLSHLLGLILFQTNVSEVLAAVDPPKNAYDVADSCSNWTTPSGNLQNEFILGSPGSFDFSLSGLIPSETYKIFFREQQAMYQSIKLLAEQQADASGTVRFVINDPSIFPATPLATAKNELILNGDFRSSKDSCVLWKYSVTASGGCEITSVSQIRNGQACFYGSASDKNSCLDPTTTTMNIHVKNIRKGNQLYINEKVTVRIDKIGDDEDDEVGTTDGAGSVTTTHSMSSTGNHTIRVYPGSGPASLGKPVMCEKTFDVSIDCSGKCLSDEPTATPPSDKVVGAMFELCVQIPDKDLQAECNACASDGEGGDENQAGVWTAIGCIKRDPTSIMQRFISLGLGIGGGVSLIMTLAGGFILTTSQGDPKRTGQAKEMITNAVIGLIFVIFSVTILQFIGFTVFKLPGFGE